MEHELNCFEKQKKERHDFRQEVSKLYLSCDEKITENKDKIIKINNEVILFNQITKTMQEDIKEIRDDVADLKKDFRLIRDHILTAPQEYANKNFTEKAINGINKKLAYAAGIISIITWLGIFIINKIIK